MSNQSRIDEIFGRQPKKIWTALATLGLLAVAVATILPIINVLTGDPTVSFYRMSPLFKYIYACGALSLLVSRLFSGYKGSEMRVKRLSRIETWSALFFCVGAFFLFYDTGTARNWLAFTLAGAVIQCYTSIMIPRTLKKAIDKE